MITMIILLQTNSTLILQENPSQKTKTNKTNKQTKKKFKNKQKQISKLML